MAINTLEFVKEYNIYLWKEKSQFFKMGKKYLATMLIGGIGMELE